MSLESENDPWEEIEGLSPSLKSMRMRERIEPPWRRKLFDLRSVGVWLETPLRLLDESIDTAFAISESEQVRRDPDDTSVAGYRTYRLISEAVRLQIEPVFPALKLFRALCDQLDKEIREALQESQSGLDE